MQQLGRKKNTMVWPTEYEGKKEAKEKRASQRKYIRDLYARKKEKKRQAAQEQEQMQN